MTSEETMTEKGGSGPKWRWSGPYSSLLAVQTLGVAILLANMIPLYRLMALDFSNYKPDLRPWWAIAGMLLVQIAYWLRVRYQPPLPRARNIVLGHIVSFVARISFTAVTAAFTQMFLNRFESLRDMDYSPLRALGVLMVFFSMFCWTLELERLAKSIQGGNHEAGQTHRD